MKKLDNQGVTVIELLVLVIIICILSALIISTHAGIAEKQRNDTRQQDISEIRDELEVYYTQYNKYPTLNELNDTTWRAKYIKGLDASVLQDPSSHSDTIISKPAKDVYAYTVTAASGKACDNIKAICTQYTLTATLEGGGTYVKNNLN
jgi:type II secretory pathway pseudopilin PulG